MDIKIKKHYYYLRMLPSGKYIIHLREEIASPLLSVTALETPTFDNEEDAERFVKKLNEENEN
jgi:hypothetical protein